MIRKRVPNHQQQHVIQSDVAHLPDFDRGNEFREWSGNSYAGHTEYTGEFVRYVLRHWSTTIAEIEYSHVTKTTTLTYFDARYHSSTTRSFQGRILRALDRAGVSVAEAYNQLSRPTHQRGLMYRSEHDSPLIHT